MGFKVLQLAVKQRIRQVSSQAEFNKLLDAFKTSAARKEVIREAIHLLEREHPKYVKNNYRSLKVFAMITESQADISDMQD